MQRWFSESRELRFFCPYTRGWRNQGSSVCHLYVRGIMCLHFRSEEDQGTVLQMWLLSKSWKAMVYFNTSLIIPNHFPQRQTPSYKLVSCLPTCCSDRGVLNPPYSHLVSPPVSLLPLDSCPCSWASNFSWSIHLDAQSFCIRKIRVWKVGLFVIYM